MRRVAGIRNTYQLARALRSALPLTTQRVGNRHDPDSALPLHRGDRLAAQPSWMRKQFRVSRHAVVPRNTALGQRDVKVESGSLGRGCTELTRTSVSRSGLMRGRCLRAACGQHDGAGSECRCDDGQAKHKSTIARGDVDREVPMVPAILPAPIIGTTVYMNADDGASCWVSL